MLSENMPILKALNTEKQIKCRNIIRSVYMTIIYQNDKVLHLDDNVISTIHVQRDLQKRLKTLCFIMPDQWLILSLHKKTRNMCMTSLF